MKLAFILRHTVLTLMVVLGFSLAGYAFLQPETVSAQATQQACEALPDAEWRNGTCVTPGTSIEQIIARFVNIFTVVVAIAAVIMIIWGGFKYVTAAGDSGKISSAKNTIIYAVIGLAIAALAQIIVYFVLDTVTGAGDDEGETTSIIIRQPFV